MKDKTFNVDVETDVHINNHSNFSIDTLKIEHMEFKGFKVFLERVRECIIKGQKPIHCGFGYHISDCDMWKNGLCKLNNMVACGYDHL